MATNTANLRKDERVKVGFHLCLRYLIGCGVSEQAIADFVSVSRSTVCRWLENEGRMPQDNEITRKIIQEAIVKELRERFMEKALVKTHELTAYYTVQSCLDFFHRGEAPSDTISKLPDNLAGRIDESALSRYRRGLHQPRQQTLMDFFRNTLEGRIDDSELRGLLEFAKQSKIKVRSDLEGALKARIAHETGLDEKIDLALQEIYSETERLYQQLSQIEVLRKLGVFEA